MQTANSTSEFQPAGLASLRDHLHAKDQAEAVNMEIDYPPQPATLSFAPSNDISKHGIIKLDDFVKPYEEEHMAQMRAREAAGALSNTPTPKKLKTSENTPPLKPVAVGARSSKHTILLHEKYQALGIPQPLFTFGGSSENGWSVVVSFPGLNIEELQGMSEENRFNSKQEAKEAVSKRALEVIEELEKEGKVRKAGKAKKKNANGPAQQQEAKEKESGSNWVGQLLGAYTADLSNVR